MHDAVAVIPACNEAPRIAPVIREAARHVARVLVVDDGSTDDTAAVARGAGAAVLRLEKNCGVGAATRAGAAYAIGKLGAERLVFIDADGQHPADKVPELLRKLDAGYDAVFTYRDFAGSMPLLKRAGNWGLTQATGVLSGVRVRDSQSGFKAFTAEAYQKMSLSAERYGICSEILIQAGRARLKYCEIPIPTIYLPEGAGKGVRVRDGVRILAGMISLALGKRATRKRASPPRF